VWSIPGPIGPTLLLEVGTITVLSWSRSEQGLTSNAYRGTIEPGLPWAYDEICLEAANPGTMSLTPDEELPPAGAAFYYLVSARNVCGESRIGQASAGNDLHAATPCP